jgi:hypothetical protein
VQLQWLTQVQEDSLALLWVEADALYADGIRTANLEPLNQELSATHVTLDGKSPGRVHNGHTCPIHDDSVRALNRTTNGGGSEALSGQERARGQAPRGSNQPEANASATN